MVAIKQQERNWLPILDNSILYIPRKVKYQIIGELDNGAEEQLEIELITTNKKFEGAETILEILHLIDGHKSFLEIRQELEQIYGPLEQKEVTKIIDILEQLRKEKIINLNIT